MNNKSEINYKEENLYNIKFVRYDSHYIAVWNINETYTTLLTTDFKRDEIKKVNFIVKKIESSLINKKKIENGDISLSSVLNILISIFNEKMTVYINYMLMKFLNEESIRISINIFVRFIMNIQCRYKLAPCTFSSNDMFRNCLDFPTNLKKLIEVNSINLIRYKMENRENLHQVVKTIGLSNVSNISTMFLESLTEKFIYKIIEENIRFKPNFLFVVNYVFSEDGVGYMSNLIKFKVLNIEYKYIINKQLESVYLKYKGLNIYEQRIDYNHVLIIPIIKEILIKKSLFITFIKNNSFKINAKSLLRIIINEFPILFREYLLFQADQLCKKNGLLKNSSVLLQYSFGFDAFRTANLFKSLEEKYYESYISICREYVIESSNLVKNENNASKIDMYDDTWFYNYVSNNEVKTKKLYFESIKNKNLKLIIKYYFKNLIDKQEINKGKTSLDNHIDNYHKLVNGIAYFIDIYKIQSFKEISMDMIEAYYKHLKFTKTIYKEQFKLKTISTYISSLRLFIQWLIEESNFDYQKPSYNLFAGIHFNQLEDTIKNTKIVAKEVMDEIPKNLDKIENVGISRIIMIMINTPRRFKEIAYLNEDCLKFDKINKLWMMYYTPWKVLESKLIRDPNNQYDKDYINDVVLNEIKAQINDTKELREKYKIKEIFIYKKGKRNFNLIGVINNSTIINKAINNTLSEKLRKKIRITTRQFRKTIVIEMILNGSSIEEIITKLGHSNKRTTEKYYAEANKLLIADKNTARFREEFKEISKKSLRQYTISEREELFNHYCMEYRKIFYKRSALGLCKRSIFQPCLRKETNKTISCSFCKKLCAGIPNLGAWTKLKDDSFKSKYELENFYEENLKLKHEEYKEFEEYKELLEDIKSYLNVINEIQRRGITNEI